MGHLHVGILVPRPRIQPDRAAIVVDQTGAVLLEQADHRRTSGLRDREDSTTGLVSKVTHPAIQPNC